MINYSLKSHFLLEQHIPHEEAPCRHKDTAQGEELSTTLCVFPLFFIFLIKVSMNHFSLSFSSSTMEILNSF